MSEAYMGEYGSYILASEYCGLSRCPRQWPGIWQHGWMPKEFNIHCEAVIGTNGRNYENRRIGRYFLARNDQVEYLREVGFVNVHAIGLPIVYAGIPDVRRVRGSLLVVPVHSLSHNSHDWDFDTYADEIAGIRKKFTEVCVCVHGSCVEKGYWTKAFEKRGIRWIRGACHSDMKSLRRVAEIFSQFEFVTSNGFGSHIAYASAFGCRVSFWGTMAKWDGASFENDVFARNSPEAFRETLRLVSEPFLRKQYSDVFTDPWDAPMRVEWGREEIGWSNRRSPADLMKLFNWDFRTRLIRGVGGRIRKLFRLPRR